MPGSSTAAHGWRVPQEAPSGSGPADPCPLPGMGDSIPSSVTVMDGPHMNVFADGRTIPKAPSNVRGTAKTRGAAVESHIGRHPVRSHTGVLTAILHPQDFGVPKRGLHTRGGSASIARSPRRRGEGRRWEVPFARLQRWPRSPRLQVPCVRRTIRCWRTTGVLGGRPLGRRSHGRASSRPASGRSARTPLGRPGRRAGRPRPPARSSRSRRRRRPRRRRSRCRAARS